MTKTLICHDIKAAMRKTAARVWGVNAGLMLAGIATGMRCARKVSGMDALRLLPLPGPWLPCPKRSLAVRRDTPSGYAGARPVPNSPHPVDC